MGGIGSGGRRPNSGPSRTVGSVRWRREQDRRAREGVVTAPVVPVVKPRGLPAGQSAVWDMLAPHATEAGTLVPATVLAFVDLCEAIVLKRDMLALIETEGLTTVAIKTRMEQDGSGDQIGEPKAHPLLARHAALMVRVESGMRAFRLAPMGKPLEPGERAATKPQSNLARLQAITPFARRA